MSRQTTVNDDVKNLLMQALTLHLAGNVNEALPLYGQILQREPDNFFALTNLGTLCIERGQAENGVALLKRSLEINPEQAQAQNSLSCGLKELKQYDEALASSERAVALAPNDPDAYVNRGNALLALRRNEEALSDFERALALAPNNAQAHINHGIALMDEKRHAEALESFDRAIALKQGIPEAHFHRGNALIELKRLSEAVLSFGVAAMLKPDYADAYRRGGDALSMLRRLDEAVASYSLALLHAPDDELAYYCRGLAHYDAGELAAAAADFQSALRLKPDYIEARWTIALDVLPAVPASEDEVSHARMRFSEEITALEKWFDTQEFGLGIRGVGTQLPFYLAYQEENNQPILSRFGALCHVLMSPWQARVRYAPPARIAGERIKIGIVSHHISQHSVWNALIKGWMQHLDPQRFELHVFYLGREHDQETALAESLAASFTQGLPSTIAWAEAILERRPDALIYPEIGMSSTAATLANLRLAPVQLASWGHPETTGIPTLDYFISAEDLEPIGAENYYTEKLVKLPHLGCFFQRADILPRSPDLATLGIRDNEPLLISPGSPFKYAPRYDHVLAEIARRLDPCQIVFFIGPREKKLVQKLKERLKRAFEAAGADFERLAVFIPWQDKPSFYGLMQRADVYLDTLGFSGFNSAMQAVECGLPVATLAGKFMRGRLAAGILWRMNLPELVAATEQDYISLAIRLARDRAYNKDLRNRIRAASPALFDNLAPIRAFEDFLIQACSNPSQNPPASPRPSAK